MTAPDRIWASYRKQPEQLYAYPWRSHERSDEIEYLRRDPAVLAADPMVQALIGAALEEAAKAANDRTPPKHGHAPLAAHVTGRSIEDAIRALRPAATAALQRMLREAATDELRAIEAAWKDDPAMQPALIAIRNRRALKEQPE